MPLTYDIESDIRYQQGFEKGLEIADEVTGYRFVVNLLNDGSMPVGKVAKMVNVPLEFVLKIQKQLERKKKSPPRSKSQQDK